MVDSNNTKEYLGITLDLSRDALLTDFAKATLRDRYMLDTEESPQEAFARPAVAFCQGDLEFAQRIYDYASQLWFMYSTPILSNGGTSRGLPISCFLNYVGDSRQGLNDHWAENTWLSSMGGGIGGYWGDIRSDGVSTSSGSRSTGSIPFLKVVDSQVLAVSQGVTRRGAYAAYSDISHPEIEEFLRMRKPTGGDPNRKCLNLHHGINVTDAFMEAVADGKPWDLIDPKSKKVTKTVDARDLWASILEMRLETGEPYLHFIDTTNKAVPDWHKELGLSIKQSNLCCVTGDQLVSTYRGLEYVKDLTEECKPLVLSSPHSDTSLSQASPMLMRSSEEDVYKITTKEGYTHKVTLNHKVEIEGHGWVEAEYIRTGDKLILRPGTVRSEDNDSSLMTLALLAGIHTADGTSTKHSYCIDLWPNKTTFLAEHIEKSLEELFKGYGDLNTSSVTTPKFKGDVLKKVRLNSAPLKKLLEERYSYQKNAIPNFVLTGSRGVVSGYLQGLYVADGHLQCNVKSKTVGMSLASTNKEFLEQLQILWMSLGVKSSLYKLHEERLRKLPDGKGGSKEYSCKAAYRLVIGSREGCKIADGYTKLSSYRISNTADNFRKSIYDQGDLFRNSQKFTATVTSVEYVGREPVYCPEVYSDARAWIANGIVTHNSEIVLPTNEDRTAVCCLSSVNLEYFEEWSKTYMVQDLIRFLDNVLQYFIDNAPEGMAKAKFSAERERSLGLGAMGLHSFLQSKGIPFESAIAESWNRKMFKYIREQAEEATQEIAVYEGDAPDFEEAVRINGDSLRGTAEYRYGRRNCYLMAIAPNASSSIIANSSPSVEPIVANVFTHKTSSGSFQVINKHLKDLLIGYFLGIGDSKGYDNCIKSIVEHEGSVQHLEFLTDDEKEVFKTGFELDQKWIIHHASVRQQWIDQAQSINLFFAGDSHKAELHNVHFSAWKKGLKTLYYCRSRATSRADKLNSKVEREVIVSNPSDGEECLSCSG